MEALTLKLKMLSELLVEDVNNRVGYKTGVDMERKISDILPSNERFDKTFWYPIQIGSLSDGMFIGQCDNDILYVHKYIKISSKFIDSLENCLYFIPSEKYKGYCKLQVIPNRNTFCPDLRRCEIDGMLSSQRFTQMIYNHFIRETGRSIHTDVNGPCIRVKQILADQDNSFAFKCEFWPNDATEWTERKCHWPDQKLINKIKSSGFHVVPVGPIKGKQDEVYWRISFTVAEKSLVHSLSHTQFLCYALLKIFLKDAVKTFSKDVPDVLCSYFVKTLIFWIVQDTHPSLWKPQNMLLCFWISLTRMIVWVKKAVCPNFFIPHNNMIRFKIKGDAQQRMLSILLSLYLEGYEIFYRCRLDRYQDLKRSKEGSTMEMSEALNFHVVVSRSVHDALKSLNRDVAYGSAIRPLPFQFFACKTVIKIYMNSQGQLAKDIAVYLMNSYLQMKGCSLFSSYLSTRPSNKSAYQHLKKSQNLIQAGQRTDLTRGRLYLATFFYMTGKFRRALAILKRFSDSIPSRAVFVTSYRNRRRDEFDEFCNPPKILSWKENRLKTVVFDVIFSSNQLFFPNELYIEVKSVPSHLLIHPIVYIEFLRFLCYHRLKKFKNRNYSLYTMDSAIRTYCLQTSNIAVEFILHGICLEMSGKDDEACTLYAYAVNARQTTVSALLHLALLINKYLKKTV